MESHSTIQNGFSNSSQKHLFILHFNDCYNVESGQEEPVGGAARFVTALDQFKHLEPLILFSGDIISPSIMSSFTKGEQMLPVLERCNIDCAMFGNHEFDFGLDCLLEFVKRTRFPWLMSNVIYKKTQSPLGEGKISHIIKKHNVKIGLIGLIEEEWLSTLILDEDDIHYVDFVSEGRKLAKKLKEEDNVDIVIALTHMRTYNDLKLAQMVDEIDLILGGHDHVFEIRSVNNKIKLIKSGTDFRQFSKITIVFDDDNKNEQRRRKILNIQVDEINVTSKYAEDSDLAIELEKYKTVLEKRMTQVMAYLDCDLDCRFSTVRSSETKVGNFITDVMLYAVPDADFALFNSGGLRSDRIHLQGPFLFSDLVNILPYMEPLLVILITGKQIYQALENGVSQYPKLEGRFPQVSGLSFSFDSSKSPGSRVDIHSIQIQGKPLDEERKYKMVTKEFLVQGRDGYEVLKDCLIYKNTEQCLPIIQAVQEYIETLRSKQWIENEQHSPCLPNNKTIRRDSLKVLNQKLHEFKESLCLYENYICHLNPRLEGRIVIK